MKDPNSKVIVEINSGEFYATSNREETITTLLGSCIAVCFYDEGAGVGGMNHFMLPYQRAGENGQTPDPRYGIPAMELLLQEIVSLGGRRQYLAAKVFGGGEMIRSEQYNVAKANVEFTLEYLCKHGIPIVAMDVGGNFGRKIYYQIQDFQVFVRKSRTTHQSY